MPWCPKCEMEYRNGITVCSDCKIALVEEVQKEEDLVAFFQAEDKKVADKLVRYFKYSNLKSSVQYNEENEVYVVFIPPKQEQQAKKLYEAFYYVERDMLEHEATHRIAPNSDDEDDISRKLIKDDLTNVKGVSESNFDLTDETADFMDEQDADNQNSDMGYETESLEEDISEDTEESSSAYVMKEDQYKDLTGTVWIFLLFGIGGIIVVLLNVVGILTFLNGLLPVSVMGALFLLFIYIAISTNRKAKMVKSEIETENKLTEEINQWLKLHVTERFLSSIHNDDISNELNYMKKFDTIKELVIKEFDVKNLAYLDRLIEEFYSNTFDQEEY